MSDKFPSRSIQRRIAAQKGEPMPTFKTGTNEPEPSPAQPSGEPPTAEVPPVMVGKGTDREDVHPAWRAWRKGQPKSVLLRRGETENELTRAYDAIVRAKAASPSPSAASPAPTAEPPARVERQIEIQKELIRGFIRDIAELPNRTSPEDWPEAMLVTGAELEAVLPSLMDDYVEMLAEQAAPSGEPRAKGPTAQEVAEYIVYQICELESETYAGRVEEYLRSFFPLEHVGEPAPGWISVEERLPEDTRNVLTVGEMGVRVGWCRDKDVAPIQWRISGSAMNVAVTHWQPLPKPPAASLQGGKDGK